METEVIEVGTRAYGVSVGVLLFAGSVLVSSGLVLLKRRRSSRGMRIAGWIVSSLGGIALAGSVMWFAARR